MVSSLNLLYVGQIQDSNTLLLLCACLIEVVYYKNTITKDKLGTCLFPELFGGLLKLVDIRESVLIFLDESLLQATPCADYRTNQTLAYPS